ncbi:MAG TPA: hypothetical protein VGN09_07990 [Vicinamibacteria bacterium]
MALVAMAGGRVAGDEAALARKARLEFRVVATWSKGATHAIGEFGEQVKEGGSTSANMQVGVDTTTIASPCQSNVTGSVSPPAAPEGPLPLWQTEATLRRAETDDIQVDYEWRRRSPAGDVTHRGSVRLSEDGHALLDFVPAFEASSGCWENVALELSASITEDSAFRDRRIAYDLWLVSEGHGSRLTRRLQLIGRQGEKVAFDYGTFRSKLPLAPPPGKDAYLMEMAVTGSVRSRIQPDGSIEIVLTANRGAHPNEGSWYSEAHGSKSVRAVPGETLKLELPPPNLVDPHVNEPDTFRALAEQHVALILTPTLVD